MYIWLPNRAAIFFMNTFTTYLQLGVGHILDLAALDHLLFILSFVASLSFRDFRKAIYWVSAFTLGHSITLALATMHIIQVKAAWIELLIPLTIVASSITLFRKEETTALGLKFWLIAFFGLVHGLGFSNYLQSLLGTEESILVPLLAFNIGVELAQIIVVLAVLLVLTMLKERILSYPEMIQKAIALLIIAFTLPMIWERWP